MFDTNKAVNKILGKNIKKDKCSKNYQDENGLEVSECYVCGKDITYPTYRFGQPLCADCAKRGDANV